MSIVHFENTDEDRVQPIVYYHINGIQSNRHWQLRHQWRHQLWNRSYKHRLQYHWQILHQPRSRVGHSPMDHHILHISHWLLYSGTDNERNSNSVKKSCCFQVPYIIIQLMTYVEVDMECYWTVNAILTDAERRSIWLSLLFNNTPCLLKHKSIIVLLYNKCMLCISCHFRPLKPLTLRMDHAKLLDVLTSLPVSHAILPRAVCFATSRPANHVILYNYWLQWGRHEDLSTRKSDNSSRPLGRGEYHF